MGHGTTLTLIIGLVLQGVCVKISSQNGALGYTADKCIFPEASRKVTDLNHIYMNSETKAAIATSNIAPIQMHDSWLVQLGNEFEQDYMRQLKQFLVAEKAAGKVIFPKGDQWFNAFNSTPFEQVKVVILGQDPYHGPGQAHGLCFSVLPGVRFPPSLLNIFKEIHADLGLAMPDSGCLQHWAEQGVLLLNATLTVEQGKAGAHQGKGWEQFTDQAIRQLNEQREGLVFMLWGSYAQKKGQFIDTSRHLVLKAPHPSPLSAHRGFLGCGHFSAANRYLEERGETPIQWG